MTPLKSNEIQELTLDQVEHVSGGIVFAPILYTAFVSGAKWGAGVAIAVYAIKTKSK